MKTRTREIAHAGIFGSIDNPTIVTEKDLAEIAETFPEQKTAPIQFGHWADAASPRLGNVITVTYNKDTKSLTAEIEEQDVLADAVEQGFYPDVSIGAKQRASDGKMYLHHLAYLGEEAPAIKDLKENISSSLAASDTSDCIAFPSVNAKRLYLTDSNPEPKPNNTGLGTEGKPAENASSAGTPSDFHSTKEQSMTPEEIALLQAENKQLKEANAAQEKLLSDTAKTAHEAEKAALKKAVAGKLPQDTQSKLLSLCDSFQAGKIIELADGETKRTASPVAVLTEIFTALPLPVQPGEINLSDTQTVTQGKNLSAKMMAVM